MTGAARYQLQLQQSSRAVAEQLYRVGLDYSDDSSYARWRKEVQVLLGAAVHTSFLGAGAMVRATADGGAFTPAAQECLHFATLRLQGSR